MKNKLSNSTFFKDSFWAIMGNGIGNALMLLSGILIARILGKDMYGQYGVVKTTMFYIASFSALGLGLSSTKFIADYVRKKPHYIACVIRDALVITGFFSLVISLLLVLFSGKLANFVGEPSLFYSFRVLAVVVVCKAITTTQTGLLAGFKHFKTIAINSVCSGFMMLLSSVPLTMWFSINGAFVALLFSQIFNAVINSFSIYKLKKGFVHQKQGNFKKELVVFSIPVALQDGSYAVCHWSAIMLLTRLSTVGELGLYSASSQWNIIIMMIPVLLNNVILSYLSGSVDDMNNHSRTVKMMLSVNFACTFVPFLVVFTLAPYISIFYGDSFGEMKNLLRLITFAPIFEACSNVFKSEFIAKGKNWILFSFKFSKDLILIIATYIILTLNDGNQGAFWFGCITVVSSMFFLISCSIYYFLCLKDKSDR